MDRDDSGLLKIAVELEQQRRYLEALEVLRQALELSDNSIEILQNLARVCMKANRISDCISWCRQVLSSDPRDVETLYLLATGLARVKDLDEAIDAFERVLSMAPDHIGAKQNLEIARHHRNRKPPQEGPIFSNN